ncbi:MAG: flagellar basal body rod protein FlgB [Acidisphaera sp.]|nr:flagellar basal body rod protein FlgB [Acidisphaera sp.]MBV9813668.1 flagellar basal body rod protein FlgB [Acetobacteraceae bacterium]
MSGDRIALFDLAERRLAWTAQREGVLAENIANADTPGWRPRDTAPFETSLNAAVLAPTATNPRHLAGTAEGAALLQNQRGERAPDGNAVSLDREMVKVAQTDMAHAVTTDLYKAYVGMFRTALGH